MNEEPSKDTGNFLVIQIVLLSIPRRFYVIIWCTVCLPKVSMIHPIVVPLISSVNITVPDTCRSIWKKKMLIKCSQIKYTNFSITSDHPFHNMSIWTLTAAGAWKTWKTMTKVPNYKISDWKSHSSPKSLDVPQRHEKIPTLSPLF